MSDNEVVLEKQATSSEMLLYQTEDGKSKVEVRLENEMVWLSQKMLSELFQVSISTINEHIKNIFKEGELHEAAVIRNFRITALQRGSRNESDCNGSCRFVELIQREFRQPVRVSRQPRHHVPPPAIDHPPADLHDAIRVHDEQPQQRVIPRVLRRADHARHPRQRHRLKECSCLCFRRGKTRDVRRLIARKPPKYPPLCWRE